LTYKSMAQTGRETQRHSRHQIVTSITYCCNSILYPRYGSDKDCKHWSPTTAYLENRFEVLMNEESLNLMNVIDQRLSQLLANTDANWHSRSSRQRHSAQSTAGPRTLILGDSIIRNIISRNTTTCCLPQATTFDVNLELKNILVKYKTANRLIIHVGKNDIHKEQSELLKKDFN